MVHCGARYSDRLGRSPYIGEQRCGPANLVTDVQGCTYGCLGFGDCTRACNYEAIHVEDGLAFVVQGPGVLHVNEHALLPHGTVQGGHRLLELPDLEERCRRKARAVAISRAEGIP